MQEIRPIGLFAFSCLIACLTQALPDWLILLAISGVAWKYWKGLRLPSSLLYTLMISSWSLLIFSSPRIWHRNTLIGAFVVASLFNLLSPPHRQRIMRFHAGLFSLLVGVLVVPRETLPLWLYFGLSVLVCSSLVLHHLPAQSMGSLFSLSRNVLKLAIPVTLCLLPIYFFFPEIRSPSPQSGRSGMSGLLEPGKLAKLALSESLAFRVRFQNRIPPMDQLYWRAEVLEQSYGMTWSQGPAYPDREFIPGKNMQDALHYELLADPQLSGILPLLEHTTSIADGRLNKSVLWQAEKRIFRSATSFLAATASPSSRLITPTAPQLPELVIPQSARVGELVESLRRQKPEEQVASLLELFRTYRYTLQPGLLTSEDPLDEFLFESKQGFCEHFAASFASLLRLAGTPARVVVGYQGGLRLGQSPYLQVTNAEAHAWAEVWHKGEWQRVDPSSVVIGSGREKPSSSPWALLIMTWLNFVVQDMLDFVREWSEELGMVWILVGVGALGLALILIYRITHRSAAGPRWERKTLALLSRVEAAGLTREPSETVFNFFQKVRRLSGMESFGLVAEAYNLCKFGEDPGAAARLEESLVLCKAHIPQLKKTLKKASSGRITG